MEEGRELIIEKEYNVYNAAYSLLLSDELGAVPTTL